MDSQLPFEFIVIFGGGFQFFLVVVCLAVVFQRGVASGTNCYRYYRLLETSRTILALLMVEVCLSRIQVPVVGYFSIHQPQRDCALW